MKFVEGRTSPAGDDGSKRLGKMLFFSSLQSRPGPFSSGSLREVFGKSCPVLSLTGDIPNEANLNLVHATRLSYKIMIFGLNGMHSGYPFLLKTEHDTGGSGAGHGRKGQDRIGPVKRPWKITVLTSCSRLPLHQSRQSRAHAPNLPGRMLESRRYRVFPGCVPCRGPSSSFCTVKPNHDDGVRHPFVPSLLLEGG